MLDRVFLSVNWSEPVMNHVCWTRQLLWPLKRKMVSYSSKAGDEGCGVCVGEGAVSNGQGCYEQPLRQKGQWDSLNPSFLASWPKTAGEAERCVGEGASAEGCLAEPGTARACNSTAVKNFFSRSGD